MSRLTRRSFLKKATAGVALSTVAMSEIDARGSVLGANDRIRVGVAGINGRGRSHIDEFLKHEGVEVAYLIDPDSSLFESRSRMVTGHGGRKPTCVQDIRRALEDDDLDVVSVATCNHWHSLITIWACQAGKDVYVEKPLSHNVFEGRIAVEAARRHERIVQHGTQSRSSGGRAREIAAVRSGRYGKLLVSKGYCSKPRWSIGQRRIEAPPAHLDFDTWLGPARSQPYHGNLVHYNWHWFWSFGNGDIGNQGVHEMDMARWAIKGATLPRRVWSLGGRFALHPDHMPVDGAAPYRDQGETPNTQMAVMDFGETLLVFEVRGLVGEKSKDARRVGNEYYTEEGIIADGRFHPRGGGEPQRLEGIETDVRPGGPFGSFLNAVRSRRREDLNADVLEGHYSSALCHLPNISYRLGMDVPFKGTAKDLGDNSTVRETFEALEKNLSWGVGLKLDGLLCRLGRRLDFDPEAERFIDDEEANRLLTREYRAPFVVPAKIS